MMPNPQSNVGRFVWEIARMALVAIVALFISQWQANAQIARSQGIVCRSVVQLSLNQQVTLNSLIDLTIRLQSRTGADLGGIPPETLGALTGALARIPDDPGCVADARSAASR